MLIDGPVGEGSFMDRVVLSGGDAETGILQQNVNPGGTKPDTGADTPPITQQQGTVFDVVCP
jgi:hypothetical protein